MLKKKVCLKLNVHFKVRHWREQKLEAMRLQTQLWEQQSREMQEKIDEEHQKESKRREEDKKKVILCVCLFSSQL